MYHRLRAVVDGCTCRALHTCIIAYCVYTLARSEIYGHIVNPPQVGGGGSSKRKQQMLMNKEENAQVMFSICDINVDDVPLHA